MSARWVSEERSVLAGAAGSPGGLADVLTLPESRKRILARAVTGPEVPVMSQSVWNSFRYRELAVVSLSPVSLVSLYLTSVESVNCPKMFATENPALTEASCAHAPPADSAKAAAPSSESLNRLLMVLL